MRSLLLLVVACAALVLSAGSRFRAGDGDGGRASGAARAGFGDASAAADPVDLSTASTGGSERRWSSRFATPLTLEFCERVVSGRGSYEAGRYPWHEAVLTETTGPGEDATTAAPGGASSAAGTQGDGGTSVSARERRGRILLLAGRPAEAWELFRELGPRPDGEAAFLHAWAAGLSGAAVAAELLEPFTGQDVPLACRAGALRLAARSLAAVGRGEESLRLLERLGAVLPEVPDYVLLWALDSHARTGDVSRLEATHQALLTANAPGSVLSAADLVRARAYATHGAADRARTLLASLLDRVPRGERPAMLMELAELETRLGDSRRAEEHLRRLIRTYPESQEAEDLLESGATAGTLRLRLSAVERAHVLAAHGRARDAVKELTPTADPALLRLRADIQLRAGSYLAAAADYAEALARGGERDALSMELAKAYGRAGDTMRARTVYQSLLAESSSGGRAATLVYLLADAFQEEASSRPASADSAEAWFRLLVERHPGSSLAARGLLRLAHLRFARGDVRGAGELYATFLRRFPRHEDAREARYWLARVAAETGDAEGAREQFAALLRPGGADYYALLARRRLGGDPAAGIAAVFGKGTAALEPRAFEPSAADTTLPAAPGPRRALARARALLLMGEVAFAQREVDEAVRLSRGTAELQQVARWALAHGYPESTFRIGAGLLPGAGGDAVARLAYPTGYAEFVARESEETGVPAGLLWAIMRQESQFDPAVRSPAGAVGLLQLIPQTAREEAARARAASFAIGDLQNPEANLHLGALHLRGLLDSLGGDWAATIASYNAGQAQAGRWLRFPEATTPEQYVERIPFRETRHYVKTVLANHAAYQDLYGGR